VNEERLKYCCLDTIYKVGMHFGAGIFIKFEVFMVGKIEIMVFWVMAPNSCMSVYYQFFR